MAQRVGNSCVAEHATQSSCTGGVHDWVRSGPLVGKLLKGGSSMHAPLFNLRQGAVTIQPLEPGQQGQTLSPQQNRDGVSRST
jgi:hypothetical protein